MDASVVRGGKKTVDTVLEMLRVTRRGLLHDAVQTDNPDIVELIQSIQPVVKEKEDVINLAYSRGNCKIIQILDPKFNNDITERKVTFEQEIVRKMQRRESCLDVIPNSKDIDYTENMSLIKDLLPKDESKAQATIAYDDLFKFHMPPVHFEDYEMSLRECRTSCIQQESCKNIRNVLRIAEYIKSQLGMQDRLFQTLKKPLVVGSLRENTRLFSLDEMDVTLMLGDELSPYLFFNKTNHTVQIFDTPAGHPLEDYMDSDHCFDLKKYVDRYFTLLLSALMAMEARWPEELSDIPLRGFSTRYSPCVRCMDAAWTRARAVRCHHEPGCAHTDQCSCRGFTRPCVSISKIGEEFIAV